MLKKTFINLIGAEIVASGRSIKVYNLDLFSKNNFEITPEQYVVIDMIITEENTTQAKLCRILGKDKSNINRLLTILEEKELIKKEQVTENKKLVNKITITPKGKELRDKIKPVVVESRTKYLNDITQDEMYNCLKVLSKIQENLVKI